MNINYTIKKSQPLKNFMAFEHSKIINLPTVHVTRSKKKNHLISTEKKSNFLGYNKNKFTVN